MNRSLNAHTERATLTTITEKYYVVVVDVARTARLPCDITSLRYADYA